MHANLSQYITRILHEAIDDESSALKARAYALITAMHKKFNTNGSRADIRFCTHGLPKNMPHHSKRRFLFIEASALNVDSIHVYYAHDYIAHRTVDDDDVEKPVNMKLPAYQMLRDDDFVAVTSHRIYGADEIYVFNIDKLERIVNIAKNVDQFIIMLMQMGARREIDFTK